MSRTKRVAIAAAVVVAGSLGLAGVANASDYSDSNVEVAGVNVGDTVHDTGSLVSHLGDVVHDVVHGVVRTVHDVL